MYYNTTKIGNPDLTKEWIKAAKQEDLVLVTFKSFPSGKFTPFDVQRMLKDNFRKDYPVTSIRRAITDLTNDGKLHKTKYKTKGKYGKMNYTWGYGGEND